MFFPSFTLRLLLLPCNIIYKYVSSILLSLICYSYDCLVAIIKRYMLMYECSNAKWRATTIIGKMLTHYYACCREAHAFRSIARWAVVGAAKSAVFELGRALKHSKSKHEPNALCAATSSYLCIVC